MSPPSSWYSNSAHPRDTLRILAAALGGTGVMFGAMGAHAVKDRLAARKTLPMWQTASTYQILHAVAILGLAAMCLNSTTTETKTTNEKTINNNNNNKKTPDKNDVFLRAGKLMALGTTLFSGSIYCLALNIGPKMILGPATPIGGLIMIGGWIVTGL